MLTLIENVCLWRRFIVFTDRIAADYSNVAIRTRFTHTVHVLLYITLQYTYCTLFAILGSIKKIIKRRKVQE